MRAVAGVGERLVAPPEGLLVPDPLRLQDLVYGLPLVGHGHPQLAQHRERAHDVEVDAASRHDEWHLEEVDNLIKKLIFGIISTIKELKDFCLI